MKRLLPYLFAFASCNAAIAEVVDVPARYGTTYANGNLTAAQTWGTYAAFKVARPAWAGKLEYQGKLVGMTQAEIEAAALRTTRAEDDMQEAIWANETCLPCGQNYADGNNQRASIDFKLQAVFKQTTPFEPTFAKFDGGGTSAYGGSGWVTGGTEWVVDLANWNARMFPVRGNFLCNGWGGLANDGGAYAEGLEIKGFSLSGGASLTSWNPGYECYGIAIRNSGSTCKVSEIASRGHNTAEFAWAGGIPIYAINTRGFYGRYGYLFIGTALSNGTLIACESDDNSIAMFGMEPGFGQAGGGSLVFIEPKSENGKNLRNGAYTPQKLLYARTGGGVLTFIGFKSAIYNGVVVPAAFDFQGTNTELKVSGEFECGSTGRFTHLLETSTYYYNQPTSTGNTCTPIDFSTSGTQMICGSRPLTGGKLSGTGSLPSYGTCYMVPYVINSTICPPCPDPVTCPPPVVCPVCPTCPPVVACPPAPTYLLGPWYKSGYCRSGLQTWRQQKVYFSGVNGKVTTTTDSQPCSVTVHP